MLEVDVGMRQPGVVHFISPRKELMAPHVPIEPLGEVDYFEKREGFNPRSLLMNPMVLMMGFSLFSMVILPQMMKNMDPEALKEMQEAQSKLLSGGGLPSASASSDEKSSEGGKAPRRVK
jgi:hypothetical protein